MIEFFPTCVENSVHVLKLERFFQVYRDDVKPSLAFAEALAHCGWYSYERDQILTAKQVLETAEEICLELMPSYNLTLGLIYNNIGAVYVDLRDRKRGAEFTLKAIQHREACLKRGDPNIQKLATSNGNYANHLRKLDQKDKARQYYFKGLEIRKNGPGMDCLEEQVTVDGKDHTLTAISHHRVGCIAFDLGKIDEGLSNLRKALDILKRVDQGSWGPLARTTLELGRKPLAIGREREHESLIAEGRELIEDGKELASRIQGPGHVIDVDGDLEWLVRASHR
ncbi:hypothetical protein SLS58_000502 [Diplodia intermedia]|uniref:Uncharacterized protein n=1 Tax=Diplodia intermedia TaxID=856260 RepID=A0ABR3U3N4_9PEZI